MSLEEKKIEKLAVHPSDNATAGKPITDEHDNKQHEREQAKLMVKALRFTKDESNAFKIDMGNGAEIKDVRPIQKPTPDQNIALGDSSRNLSVTEDAYKKQHHTEHHPSQKTGHQAHSEAKKHSEAKHETHDLKHNSKTDAAHKPSTDHADTREKPQPKPEEAPRAHYPVDPRFPAADLHPAGPGWTNVDMSKPPHVNQVIEDMPINTYNCKFYLKTFIEGQKPDGVRNPVDCEIQNGYMEKHGYHKAENYQDLKEGDVIMVKDPNRIAISNTSTLP